MVWVWLVVLHTHNKHMLFLLQYVHAHKFLCTSMDEVPISLAAAATAPRTRSRRRLVIRQASFDASAGKNRIRHLDGAFSMLRKLVSGPIDQAST